MNPLSDRSLLFITWGGGGGGQGGVLGAFWLCCNEIYPITSIRFSDIVMILFTGSQSAVNFLRYPRNTLLVKTSRPLKTM